MSNLVSWKVFINNSVLYWIEKDDRKEKMVNFAGISQSWEEAKNQIKGNLLPILKEHYPNFDKDKDILHVIFNEDSKFEKVNIAIENDEVKLFIYVNYSEEIKVTVDFDYRPNVVIGLIKDKAILFGERIKIPNSWQMPQGGIDPGEPIHEAGLRELTEELGLEKPNEKVTFLGFLNTPNSLIYNFPPTMIQNEERGEKYKGQHQFMVLFDFKGKDSDICLNRHDEEFSKYLWIPIVDMDKMAIPWFKEAVYASIYKEMVLFVSMEKRNWLTQPPRYPGTVTNLTDLKDHGII